MYGFYGKSYINYCKLKIINFFLVFINLIVLKKKIKIIYPYFIKKKKKKKKKEKQKQRCWTTILEKKN
jgi:hypothetical protein